VKEQEPTKFNYCLHQLVKDGPLKAITLTIQACTDPHGTGAPVYLNSSITDLVKLTADLSCIPEKSLEQRKGADGRPYYYADWHIEMRNYSASTLYDLVYKGVHYASVKAEYV
ncbi:hypothetical protein MMC13_002275, partial [Lambiella insularis]|nr:hypothetical protein [Lambiella insularis]